MKQEAINKLCTIKEVIELINAHKTLVLAGNEDVLKDLPTGNWIGGTIPYFMDTTGGTFSKNKIFVTDLSSIRKDFKICVYNKETLNELINDRYANGFTYLLVPAFSEMHKSYAISAENTQGLYDAPIVGWVTGIDLEELGSKTPKVIDGRSKEVLDDNVVALHIKLEEGKYANLEILNIFQQGSGDELMFKDEGFECTTCLVNGKETNFAEYLTQNNIDIRLPLVADYSGANINISVQDVNTVRKEVKFYAPLRKDVVYKIAEPVDDYMNNFLKIVPNGQNDQIIMSCNCILNYLYSELEHKKTGNMTGPITFGEIAYVVVNQTMVYLSVE